MVISTQKDVRVTIISRIWAYATAMLFVSALLHSWASERRLLFLPITIVFGATTSTSVVLRKLRYHRHSDQLTPETIEELKQRIENLEEIVTSDVKVLDRSLQQLNQITRDRA